MSSSRHIGLRVLKAKIRGFFVTGTTITQYTKKSSGMRKASLWDQKRELGTVARHHLIAYGLLRGVPYERIEKCAEQNRPRPQLVLDIMLAHADWQQKRDLNLEKVKGLLLTTVCVDAVPVAQEDMLMNVSTKGMISAPQRQSQPSQKSAVVSTMGRLLRAIPLALEKRQ